MAAARRTLSPGGALLRSSRMFSLPSQLPPPPGDHNAATIHHSDTATAPFPTLQTVTAPEAFRQRGDWGFKRNFPLRSTTRTATPYLRVKQVDSIEHVTDFDTAADHTLSLEKWQELNVAISLPHSVDATSEAQTGLSAENALESVFEDKYDFTAMDDTDKISGAGQKRWKFKGPWLANLTEGEFQAYIKKQVRGRRPEFREFLRVCLAPKLTEEARRKAMDDGLDEVVPDKRPEDVTDEDVLNFLRQSRESREDLYNFIGQFLDLAPLARPTTRDYIGEMQAGQTKKIEDISPYAIDGPPATHPSAGLSYLRTNSYLENHPVYGPQRRHKAVKGRIISPGDPKQHIGVGGFVSPSRISESVFKPADRSAYKEPGGPKVWTNVISAQVNSRGRGLLKIEEAEGDSKMVQQEMDGERRIFHQEVTSSVEQAMEVRYPTSSKQLSQRNRNRAGTWATGSSSAYGTDDWADKSRRS